MWLRNWIEQQISIDSKPIKFAETDNVVAVRVKNIGTATVFTGWQNEGVPNEIPSGAADIFDAGDSGIIEGELKITFDAVGTKKAVVLMLKNVREIC